MKNLSVVGKYLYVVPMLVFGLMHFMKANDMAGIVPSFIPGGVFWVYLTGLALVLAAVAVFINKNAKLATMLLGAMLMIFVLTIHLPGLFEEATVQMSMANMLKDLALAGGAFFLSGSYDS